MYECQGRRCLVPETKKELKEFNKKVYEIEEDALKEANKLRKIVNKEFSIGYHFHREYIEELFNLIKKSYCYINLSKKDFKEVIEYLAGRYISLEDRHIYAKIWYDEETGMIGRKGKLARVLYMTNIGTIPEESFVTVKLSPNGEKIGVIDEGFLSRMKKGDVFVLGGKKYQYRYTRGMNLYVSSQVKRAPNIPSAFLSFPSAR